MKTKKMYLLILSIGFLTMIQGLNAQSNKGNKETVVFDVEELNCKKCQAKVEKNIAFEKGVSDIKCDLTAKTVTVQYDKRKTNASEIQKGFERIKMEALLQDSTKLIP